MRSAVLLFVCLFGLPAHAQRNQAVQALNKYVDYCNLTNNYLRILQPELDRFNDALDYTVGKKQQQEEWGNNNLGSQDYLNDAEYWEIFPETVYKECLTFSNYLPPAEKKRLNTKITGLRSLILAIDRHCRDSVNRFINNKEYLRDFNHSYVILKRIEALYVKYDSARVGLATDLQQVYDKQYKIAATDYLQCLAQANPAVQLCHKMAGNLLREDTLQLAANARQLDSLIAELIKNKSRYLKGMPDEKFPPRDGANPHLRYIALTDELKSFLAGCQSFLKSRSYPYAEWYTKGYYYYNERLSGTHELTTAYNFLNILVTGDKFYVIKMDILGDKPGFASLRDAKYRSLGIVVPERYVLRSIGSPRMFRLRKK